MIEDTPNLKGIKDLFIAKELKEIFNLPVFLLNDADAAGLGEWWLEAGRKYSSLIYITLSTGVGSALVVNGYLQRGLGKAPEWGHTSLAIENKWQLCSCGQWSCAEAYLGTNGLARIYADIFELKIGELSNEDKYSVSYEMRQGVKAENRQWLKVQERYARYLSVLLRNIILGHQPQTIILGGGIAFGNKPLLDEVQKQLRELMDPQKDKMAVMAENVKISLAQSAHNVNLGAAKYAFDQIDLARRGEKTYGDIS